VTDEDNSQGTDAAEAFEAMCVELALLRRAVEGLAAERGAIDFPDYTETLGRMQKGVDATAEAGEDKARVMAELRAIAGSAWTLAEQKNRQLWFGLGGVAIGVVAWAIVPGFVAREIAPASWQWPARLAARTLDMPRWEAGQRMMQSADPAAFRAVVAADRIVTANRKTIEGCSKAAARARETVRCTIRVRPDGQDSR